MYVVFMITGRCYSSAAEGTADFLLLFDKLFDSFNGSTIKPEHGETLRCAISKGSEHHKFWNESLPVLRSIKFISKAGKETVPPCIKNWITTIKGKTLQTSYLKYAVF